MCPIRRTMYWRSSSQWQFAIFRELGLRTVFVGTLDEVHEGMAIYKVADKSPSAEHFVNYEGTGSDLYLKPTGAATPMIRGETPHSAKIQVKLPFPKD